MLAVNPVEKSSRQVTLAPGSTSTSHKWLPIKPAPPETKMSFPSGKTSFISLTIRLMSSETILSITFSQP